MKKLIYLGFILFSMSCEESDLTSLAEDIDEINTRLDRIETRLDSIETKLESLESNITILQDQGKLFLEEFESLNTTIDGLTELVDSTTTNQADLIQRIQSEIDNLTQVTEFDSLAAEFQSINMILDGVLGEGEIGETSLSALSSAIDRIEETLIALQLVDTFQDLNGFIEKGAFLSGSLLMLHELDSTLRQTGRSFASTLLNDFGEFELGVTNLKGKTCLAICEGFYYNEVTNQNSVSPINLTGLVRIDTNEIVNVNVLTHIERLRVERLMKSGSTFDSAKSQALNEVLGFFGVTTANTFRSERVNFINSDSSKDVLLPLSIITQGFRSESQLTEILSRLGTDLSDNGKVDDSSLGNNLKSHVYYLSSQKRLSDFKSRYNSFFADSVLSNMDVVHLDSFRTTQNFSFTDSLITYPKMDQSKLNVLNSGFTSGPSRDTNGNLLTYNVSAMVSDRISLKIAIQNMDGSELSGLGTANNINWTLRRNSRGSLNGVFENSTSGNNSINVLLNPGKYKIVYFEREGEIETFSKEIEIN